MTLPNQLTILRILLTPVFVLLFIGERLVLKQVSVLVFAVAALTDWYDGWVARKTGNVTKWGVFLDPLADKILTSAAFIAFAWLGMVEWWMVWVIVARDISITLLRSFSELRGCTLHTNYSAKVKTFAQMVFIYGVLLAVVFKNSVAEFSPIINVILNKNVLYYSMFVVTILTLGTGLQYLIENFKIVHSFFRSVSGRTESE
ncbi:MAG: CDP-diacylglycerol--glycerol-3-phosphate 3-phosphatidyltransferase [Bacteroidetes bacterium]|nr:CDP-diacylglycerol--glycerol-3-phosphate 3-phosphatidyltransferase [Bacteroidota bacterium]MCL5738981.1 CDP-diacylglycerol--glycerol-3-phosphate 3-phosphatidyltransferase [Bacteroidota bacterium]